MTADATDTASPEAPSDRTPGRPGSPRRPDLPGLVGLELNRYRSRRAIAWILLIGTALLALAAAKTVWDSRGLSDDERASAQAQAYAANQEGQVAEQIADCRSNPTVVFGPDATASDCDHLRQTPADFYHRQPLSLPQLLQRDGVAVTVLVTGLLVLCGCTFVGADQTSGSTRTQLLAEPRRVRVWWAKGVAVMVASLVVAAVLLAGYWATMLLTANARGIAVTDGVRRAVLEQAGRGLGLAVAGALGAFALTMLFRHTSTTLALLFVYSVGGELLVNLLPVSSATRWSLGNNVSGWLRDGYRYFDDAGHCATGCVLGHVPSGLFLLALLVIAVVVSQVSFSRRDV